MDDQEYDIVDAVLRAVEVAQEATSLMPDAIMTDQATADSLLEAVKARSGIQASEEAVIDSAFGMKVCTNLLDALLCQPVRPLYLETVSPDHFKASFVL